MGVVICEKSSCELENSADANCDGAHCAKVNGEIRLWKSNLSNWGSSAGANCTAARRLHWCVHLFARRAPNEKTSVIETIALNKPCSLAGRNKRLPKHGGNKITNDLLSHKFTLWGITSRTAQCVGWLWFLPFCLNSQMQTCMHWQRRWRDRWCDATRATTRCSIANCEVETCEAANCEVANCEIASCEIAFWGLQIEKLQILK